LSTAKGTNAAKVPIKPKPIKKPKAEGFIVKTTALKAS
jgi:hypothetical protein